MLVQNPSGYIDWKVLDPCNSRAINYIATFLNDPAPLGLVGS